MPAYLTPSGMGLPSNDHEMGCGVNSAARVSNTSWWGLMVSIWIRSTFHCCESRHWTKFRFGYPSFSITGKDALLMHIATLDEKYYPRLRRIEIQSLIAARLAILTEHFIIILNASVAAFSIINFIPSIRVELCDLF
jgi:hypothetical protein